jgi:protein-S-isoprenylcysteine O-methyltransferase Ste14
LKPSWRFGLPWGRGGDSFYILLRGDADVSESHLDAPDVKIIPPLVYLAGLVIGLLASVWVPTKILPNLLAWILGGIVVVCGAVLAGSAILKFKDAGTTVRPDRASNKLVIVGPYKITRNPMYVGLALVYAGISIADQSAWALILLAFVLSIIQRRVIEPEEAFLERRFGPAYIRYKERVSRWI